MTETQEELMEKILHIYYTHLWPTPYATQQVHTVLQQQFADGEEFEIGGSIVQNPAGLEFRIVRSEVVPQMERALQQYTEGDFSGVDLLVQFAQEQVSHTSKELSYSPAERRHVESLLSFLQDEKIQRQPESRNDVKSVYTNLVLQKWRSSKRRYIASFQELGVVEKAFRGLFHVHQHGLPPSSQDLDLSKTTHFPQIVIAALKTYQETGLTLYLVHSQGYEELFKGKLPENI